MVSGYDKNPPPDDDSARRHWWPAVLLVLVPISIVVATVRVLFGW